LNSAGGSGLGAKVFVSYSRKDLGFVDEFDAALRQRGVEPLVDRTEIYAFEDWWKRIRDLIARADTIVFVLSPDALASEVCAREVAFAASLHKRFAPIVARAVDPADVPADLRRLNFIHFEDGVGTPGALERLVEALSTDIGWVRRHSEYGEIARRWAQAGRPGPQGMLLRSPLLEEAESWIAARPANAPVPTDETRALILASRRAATRRRQAVTAVLAVGLALALALSGFAFWQRQAARESERAAIAARSAEAEQRRLAEERERQAVEAGNRTLVGQSRFLADLANRSLETGDAGSAVLFALEALPDREAGKLRPVVPEAEQSLDRALTKLAEQGLAARHAGFILAFSPDGRWAVSQGGGEQVLTDLAGSTTTRTSVPGEAVAVAFSADSKRLVRCFAGAIQVVDLAGGAEVRIDPARDGALSEGSLQTCALTADGGIVAVGAGGRLGWWRAATGDPLGRAWLPGDDETWIASADASRLAARSRDGTVRVADGRSGRMIATLAADVASGRLDLSADGRRVLTAGDGEAGVRVWDVASGTVVARIRVDAARAVLSPNGGRVVVAPRGTGGGLEIWDVETEAKLASVDAGLRPTSFGFGRDGRRLVIGGADGSVRVFETQTGGEIARLGGHQSRVIAAIVSPDGSRVLSSAYDSRLVLWTLRPERDSRRVAVSRAAVTAMLPLRGGSSLLAASADGSLHRLDMEGRERTTLALMGGTVVALASGADGRRVLVLRRDGTAQLTDPVSGAAVASFQDVPPHAGGGTADRILTPVGKHFVLASGSRGVAMHDGSDGGEIWRSAQSDTRRGGAFVTPDGRRVVAWSGEGTADILDAKTGRRLASIRNAALTPDGRPFPGDSGRRTLPWSDLAASPDGRRLVTSGVLQPRVWDVASGEPERVLVDHKIGRETAAMAFGPDPAILFTIEAGRSVTAWDLGSGARLRSFEGHTGTIRSLRIAEDGRRLLTASDDGSARVWDIESGVEVARLEGGSGAVLEARFWPDGRIAAAFADGTIRLWPHAGDVQDVVEQAKQRMSRCLTPAQRRRAFLDPAPPTWCLTGPGREHETDPARWLPRPPYNMPVWERWHRSRQAGEPVALPWTD
jgi:WD40 repeat protein